jgi:hypothetical protein
MKCYQCGSDVAEGAASCPGCGAPWPPAAAGPGASPGLPGDAATVRRPAPAPAFRFDAARWTLADRVAGGATLVLFISLFLPWFSVSAGFGNFTASGSADALTAHGYLYLVLLLALGMIGYLIARAALRDLPDLPVAHDQLLAVAAGVNLLLVLIAVIVKPGGGSSLVKVSWSFGAFVGLIAAIAAFAPLARAALRARPGRGARELTRDSAG